MRIIFTSGPFEGRFGTLYGPYAVDGAGRERSLVRADGHPGSIPVRSSTFKLVNP